MERTSGERGNSPKLGTRLRKVDKLADLRKIIIQVFLACMVSKVNEVRTK